MCAEDTTEKKKIRGKIPRKRPCVPISPLPVFLSNSVFALLTSRHSRLAPPTPNFMSTLVPPPRRSHILFLLIVAGLKTNFLLLRQLSQSYRTHISDKAYFSWTVECHLSIQSSSSSTHPLSHWRLKRRVKMANGVGGGLLTLSAGLCSYRTPSHVPFDTGMPYPIEGNNLNGHENQFYGRPSHSHRSWSRKHCCCEICDHISSAKLFGFFLLQF